jgi:hypothetical protein
MNNDVSVQLFYYWNKCIVKQEKQNGVFTSDYKVWHNTSFQCAKIYKRMESIMGIVNITYYDGNNLVSMR